MAVLYLLFALLIAIVAVIFAMQNSVTVTVTLFAWTFTGSLSLVLLVTLLVGICVGALVLLPGTIKKSFQATGLKRRIAKMGKKSAVENSAASGPAASEGVTGETRP